MKSIADFLVIVEEIVVSVAQHDRPDLNLKKHGAVRVTSLQEGSLHYAYKAHDPIVSKILRQIGQAIEDDDWSSFPTGAVEKLRKLAALNRKHNSQTVIRESLGPQEILAVFTPNTRIAEMDFITRTATLYGELRRIGGDEPKAYIRFLMDDNIHGCDISTPELAQEIAGHLYKIIGVRGSAKWEIETMKLHSFCIGELTEYRETSLTEAFDSLSEVAAKHYADLEDVDAFVAELRGRGPKYE